MDTRRASGSVDRFRPIGEPDTDTVPVELVELAEIRHIVPSRQGSGLRAMLSAFVLFGVLTVIVILAIATSAGWSVVRAWG